MPSFRALLAVLVLPFAGAALLAADAHPATVAYQGGRILTAAGPIFDPGTLVVSQGKIVEVGPSDTVAIPKDAQVEDVSGKVIIPGLVDTHSHLGVYSRPGVQANSDGNEMTGPVQGIVRALDSLNPYDPGIRMANAGGVTTANVMPGSGNVIGGQTIYVKLRGYTPEQMWIASPDVLGGLKMANGENPKRAYGSRDKAPGTRMKVAALQRSEFLSAKAYMAKWDQYRKKLGAGETASPPDIDLGLEPLVEVLQHKRHGPFPHASCGRHFDCAAAEGRIRLRAGHSTRDRVVQSDRGHRPPQGARLVDAGRQSRRKSGSDRHQRSNRGRIDPRGNQSHGQHR